MEGSTHILSDDAREQREQLVEMLKKGYWMEIETVMSYISNSINPDGIRAREIYESLNADIQEELATRSSSAAASRSCTAWCPVRWSSRPSRATCSRPRTRST